MQKATQKFKFPSRISQETKDGRNAVTDGIPYWWPIKIGNFLRAKIHSRANAEVAAQTLMIGAFETPLSLAFPSISSARGMTSMNVRIAALILAIFCMPAQSADIRDFGACGGQSDDTLAVQTAIEAALVSSTDNTVTFSCLAPLRSVNIVLSSGQKPVTLNSSQYGFGVKQIGKPTNSVIGADSGAALFLDRCHNCVVKGLTIDGNGFGGGIAVQRSVSPQIIENTLFGQAGGLAAIVALGNSRGLYARNHVYSSGGVVRGMWIGNSGTGTSEDYEIRPIIIDNYLHDLGSTGINVMASDALVQGNTARRTGGAGLAISSTRVSVADGIMVSNNTFTHNKFHGIQSDSWHGSRSRNVTISGNTTDHNYSSGIYAVNASHWNISGNYCRDNNIDGKDTGAGLIIDHADNVVATQNVCTSSEHKQTAGILVGHGGVGAPGITGIALFNNVLTGHSKNDLLNFHAGAVENYALGSVYKY